MRTTEVDFLDASCLTCVCIFLVGIFRSSLKYGHSSQKRARMKLHCSLEIDCIEACDMPHFLDWLRKIAPVNDVLFLSNHRQYPYITALESSYGAWGWKQLSWRAMKNQFSNDSFKLSVSNRRFRQLQFHGSRPWKTSFFIHYPAQSEDEVWVNNCLLSHSSKLFENGRRGFLNGPPTTA